MKAIYIRIQTACLLIVLSLGGCDQNFTEINTNPTVPVSVQPEFLLRQVLFDYIENASHEGFVAGNLLGQYFMAVDFNLFDRHSLTQPQNGGNPWPFLFENLRDNENLLALSRENPVFQVYEGPALVLRALMFAQLTDLYGDIPYSEALQGRTGGITQPRYDAQEDIYLGENGLIATLREAVEKLQAAAGAPQGLAGDILFRGDLKKWERFANSLRFKLLMRISGAVDVRAELQAMWAAGELILAPEDDAFFNFTAGQPNNFRLVTARVGDFNLFLMSETMEGILNRFEDPRAGRYFRPTANDPQAFRGLRNGQDASQLSISIADFSLSGRIFREEGGAMRGQFLTSFEQKFFVAEAMQRGLLSGDPQPWYEAAVQEAFAFWQVPLPATYLSQGPASFATAADKIELIMVQKWLAMPVNFYEGWTEHRRTGFPALLPVAASLNNGVMPRRMPYPATEDALNNANFQKAAAATEGNSFNVDVWWAKR